jgi:hypothetical protein
LRAERRYARARNYLANLERLSLQRNTPIGTEGAEAILRSRRLAKLS